jgi:hypothetical protein
MYAAMLARIDRVILPDHRQFHEAASPSIGPLTQQETP